MFFFISCTHPVKTIYINKNLIEEKDNQNHSLLKSIEILAEMTRDDIERSSFYFDININLEKQNQ